MKRGGMGKRKGSAFEREVCKRLSKWVTAGERDDVFWRAAMSGGRATNRFKRGTVTGHQAGDISSVHPSGHAFADYWFIECKHVRDLRLHMLVFGTGGNLSAYWSKAFAEASKYDRAPMLIAKQNQYPVLVLIPEDERQRFRWARVSHLATIRHEDCDVAVLDFDLMCKAVPKFAVKGNGIHVERVLIRPKDHAA